MDVAHVAPAKAARLLFQLPVQSRICVALQPSNAWGWQEILLNKANYLLEILVWQNTNNGVKKSKITKKPEPFIPEFMKSKEKSAINKESVAYDTDTIKDMLSKPRG